MTTFKYKAVSESGVEVTGVLQARDQSDAVIQLKEKYILIQSIKPVAESEDILQKFKSNKIKEKNLALVCKQFSIILSAGLPIMRTVELVAGQTTDKVLKQILTEVAGDVGSGFSLASSFALRGKNLPATFIETVRAGEESGALEEVFERLSVFYTKKAGVRSKVISALTYPAFVMVVAVVVIAIIMIYAVPLFTQTFLELGIELPLPTRMLIAMSNFMTKYFLVILGILALLIVGVGIYSRNSEGRIKLSKLNLRLPILGNIQMMSSCSQFANTLSTMMAAGLPVIKALGITGKAISNAFLGETIMDTVADVESGFRIGDSMKKKAVFPDLLTEMTAVGEESGSLERTLTVIGEYYDNEVEVTTSRAVSLLEPIIICFLAVFVVFVLLAVYMPMFGMYGNIT